MSDRRFTGQALDLARRTGNRLLEARLLNNIGTIEFTLGEFDDAGETWETALALSRELEWTYGESIVLLNLAGLATATGANEEAITRGTAAVERAKASASRDLEAAAFLHLGVAHSRLGHGVEARAALTRSRGLFVQNGGEHYAVDPIAALAFLDLAEGEPNAPWRAWSTSSPSLRRAGSSPHRGAIPRSPRVLHRARSPAAVKARTCSTPSMARSVSPSARSRKASAAIGSTA